MQQGDFDRAQAVIMPAEIFIQSLKDCKRGSILGLGKAIHFLRYPRKFVMLLRTSTMLQQNPS